MPAAELDDAVAARALTESWCAVLRVPEALPEDHFFHVGGDSIAGLRLLARLREYGFTISLQQLYENPRFGDVVRLLVPVQDGPAPWRGIRRLPLLPVQIRTLEYDRVNPHHHNDDAIYAVPTGVTVGRLREAVAALVAHHPVLTSRFRLAASESASESDSAEQSQELGHPVDLDAIVLEVAAEPGDTDLVTEIGTAAHTALSLTDGRVLAVRVLVWQGRPWALLVVIHHLVCDAMSWEVIGSDLARLIAAQPGPAAAELPGSAGWPDWVDFVVAQSAGPAFTEHLAYWRSRPWSRVTRLPLRPGADRTVSNLRVVRSVADLGDGMSFRRAAAALGGDAVILGAMNYALRAVFGVSTSLVDLVINGRDEIPGAPDISRTVGWFAEFTPVVTDLCGAGDPLPVIQATASQLRAMPGPRMSFGCLRHLSPDAAVRREFQRLPAADVYLNFRGDLLSRGGGPLTELAYYLGPFQCQQERHPYPLKVMCDIADGTITGRWKYSPVELSGEAVERVGEAFSAALRALADADGMLDP
jgi:aryl carrier-like protein